MQIHPLTLHALILLSLMLPLQVPAAEMEPVLPDETQQKILRNDLAQWHRLSESRSSLKEAFQTIDAQNDPERDERFWWNPFRQNARETQAQEANHLLLQIQMVARDLKKMQPTLLDRTSAFAHAAIAQPMPLNQDQLTLWMQSDTWRVPIILKTPDWKQFSRSNLTRLSPELYQNRLRFLQEKRFQWETLKTYLEKKQPGLSENAVKQQHSDWEKITKDYLEKLNKIIPTTPDKP